MLAVPRQASEAQWLAEQASLNAAEQTTRSLLASLELQKGEAALMLQVSPCTSYTRVLLWQ